MKRFRYSDCTSMATKLNNNQKELLSIKFFMKDHNVGDPLRFVLNKDDTWRKSASVFLQKGLSCSDLKSSLSLRYCADFGLDLKPFHEKSCTMFFVDVKDLNYSLPRDILLSRVNQFLKDNLVSFQFQSGIHVSVFLKVLEFNLRSKALAHRGQKLIQRQGVCKESAVASALSEIFLRFLD